MVSRPPPCSSAASPVTAIVTTVVVMSGTFSRRTVAFWMPMPNASSAAATTARTVKVGATVTVNGTITGTAATTKTSSTAVVHTRSRPRWLPNRSISCPPA